MSRSLHRLSQLNAIAVSCVLSTGAAAATAPLVLDDFTAPDPAARASLSRVGDQFFNRTFSTFAGVGSQVREVTYNLYEDPRGHLVDLSLGAGSASVFAFSSALGEYLFSYGAFTRPNGDPSVAGPNLKLDLSHFNDLQAVFPSVNLGLNVVVTLFTAAPKLLPNGQPLYYLTSGVNLAPAIVGGPMVADLFFDARNPSASANAPYFNFNQVDGIFFEIDRSGFSTGNRYSLDKLQFAQVVPEPAQAALWLGGLAALFAWRIGAGAADRSTARFRNDCFPTL